MSRALTKPYSGFSPQDIGECYLWLDSADTSSLTFSSGTTVSSWRDKSGKGNDTTSFTGGTRSSTTSGITNPICSGPIQNSGNTIVTIFYVASKPSSSGSYDNIIALNANTITNYYAAGTLFCCYYGSTSPGAYYAYMNGNLSLSFNATTFGTPFIFNAYQSSTVGSTFGNDNNYGAVGTPGSTFTYTKYWIGTCTGGPALVGNLYEVIIYNIILTQTERQQVAGYLANKWGITSYLPAGQPYISRPPFLYEFKPPNISNCSLWLDSSDDSTITFSSGTTVSAWADKSGNGNNTTSFTGGTRSSSTSGIQGPICSGPITNSGSSTVNVFYVASKPYNGTSYDNIIALNANTITNYYAAGTLFCCYYGSTSPGGYYAYMNGNLSLSFNATTFGTPFIFNAYQFQSTGTTYGNGTNYGAVGTPGSTFTYTKYWIGTCTGGPAFVGNLYEVIVYKGQLSSTQRIWVEGYLAWKWGLQSSLPSTHQFKKYPPYNIV
jgi:hypothetical protein